jgi:carbon-monoxide dehydrogenase medium subunit
MRRQQKRLAAKAGLAKGQGLKPSAFDYFAPTELNEAVGLLAESDNARVLAGGQSLMAMLNMRFVVPDRIIDLNRIAELDYIKMDGDDVVIGAMTRQGVMQRSAVLASRLPVIAKALRYVGHMQTRNRGTFGGSLCQLDPAAELPALAMAYDATIEARGSGGPRTMSFRDFPAAYMTPSLEPDEILTSIRLRPWSGKVGCGLQEFSRRHGDFALGGAVALLQLGTDATIERASLTLFGVAVSPIRATAAEKVLVGNRPDRGLFEAAARMCVELATLNDSYGSASYRGHVAAAMAEDALAEAMADAGKQ